MKETIKELFKEFFEFSVEFLDEYLGYWKNLLTGCFFKSFLGWVKHESEVKDWDGLIKVILYPPTFILSVVVSTGAIPVYVVLLLGMICFIVLVIVVIIIGFPVKWVLEKLWKGIVWLDKKLRF